MGYVGGIEARKMGYLNRGWAASQSKRPASDYLDD